MGKKKKEIARLSEELKKVKIEPTGYATPRKPISPLVSTSLAGPSMHGAGYNYKNISSYGPSLTGEPAKERWSPDKKTFDGKKELRIDKTFDNKKELRLDERSVTEWMMDKKADRLNIKSVSAPESDKKERKKLKPKTKDWWQGLPPGTQDLAVESLFRLGEGAVKGVASLIATKKAARSNKSNSFAQQGRSGGGGGGYNSTSQPSYAELLNKYQGS